MDIRRGQIAYTEVMVQCKAPVGNSRGAVHVALVIVHQTVRLDGRSTMNTNFRVFRTKKAVFLNNTPLLVGLMIMT